MFVMVSPLTSPTADGPSRFPQCTRCGAPKRRAPGGSWMAPCARDEPACRPGSVPARLTTSRSATIHLGLPSPTASCGLPASSGGPPSNARARSVLLFLTLLQVGFTKPFRSPGTLVVSYTTVSPLPTYRSAPAVCSLWHFPAGHPGWVLPTTSPCGARTFLDEFSRRGRPADSSASSLGQLEPDRAARDVRFGESHLDVRTQRQLRGTGHTGLDRRLLDHHVASLSRGLAVLLHRDDNSGEHLADVGVQHCGLYEPQDRVLVLVGLAAGLLQGLGELVESVDDPTGDIDAGAEG